MRAEVETMPERVGRYEIVLPLASGGMATVYLARAQGVGGFDRYMALKLTAAHLRRDPSFARHLIEEAKLVANLRHTNVVPVFDVGECEHGVFLVMDYVPGDSFSGLRNLAREAGTKLPRAVGLKILVDALHGLHAAHEHADEDGHPLHLVHRDFSPQNILVGTDGIARLTDFGIAKAASRVSNTEAGFIKGKISYIAPEQVRGDALDRRCDVWAAGVIAWEVLAGRKLYEKGDRSAMQASRVDPPPVKTVANDISDELDDIIGRALRVDRELRTPNALVFARDLASAAREGRLLAHAEEVADHVARLVGPELTERKALLAESRRAQLQRPPSVPDVRTLIGTGGLPPKRAPLPSLPDVPIVIDDGVSELRIEVDLGRSADRANASILGDAFPAPPEQETPEIIRSPVVATSPEEESEVLRPLPTMRRSPVDRLLDAIRPWFGPPWTTKKISIAAGAAGGVIGFFMVFLAVAGSASKTAKSTTATSTSAPTQSSAVEGVVPATRTEPSAPGTEETPTLQITANGQIASVRIGDRLVDAIVPAPSIGIELEDNEREQPLRVVVTGTDGRIATATTEAGGQALDVTFGDKPPTPHPTPARPTAPATTAKHPWSKSTR